MTNDYSKEKRVYNKRTVLKYSAIALVTVALFGSLFYLMLLPQNAEDSLPIQSMGEQPPESDPEPFEVLFMDDDPCECCPECNQTECVCDECGVSDECECLELESSEPETSDQEINFDDPDIEVASVEDFVRAISPNKTITLQAGLYDVSTVVGFDSPYIEWRHDSYGLNERTLVINGVDNLTLQAAPGAEVEIVTPYKFAEVLAFSNCNDISLIGIKAGHTITGQYECDDGVIGLNNCSNIFIENCHFYGCGSVGITMRDCNNALIRDTIIDDCSRAALIIDNSNDIEFINCRFVDNRAYQYIICINYSQVTFTDCEISGNNGLSGSVIEVDYFGGTSNVLFDRCIIKNNTPNTSWYNGEPVFVGVINNPIFEGKPYIGIRDSEVELGPFARYWRNDDVTDLGGNLFN